MPKCDFNKVAKQFDIFKIPFPKNTSGGLLLSVLIVQLFSSKKCLLH